MKTVILSIAILALIIGAIVCYSYQQNQSVEQWRSHLLVMCSHIRIDERVACDHNLIIDQYPEAVEQCAYANEDYDLWRICLDQLQIPYRGEPLDD